LDKAPFLSYVPTLIIRIYGCYRKQNLQNFNQKFLNSSLEDNKAANEFVSCAETVTASKDKTDWGHSEVDRFEWKSMVVP
jgi:hypothetical protein